jgi:hypothetical protein
MSAPDTPLRAGYAAHGANAPNSPHPTADQIADVVERRGSEADRLRTLDHIGSCAHCRREFELLRATRVAARQATVSRWPVRTIGLAAAAAIVVGVTMTLSHSAGLPLRGAAPSAQPAAPTLPPERGPGSGGATQVITLIAPLGPTAPTATRFVWHRLAMATTYHVEVLDDSGSVVARTNTSDTVFTAPARTLAPGRVYRWWVQAVVEGEPLQSGFADFRTTTVGN